MLRVKTKVATSTIHGVGLIADEFIPKDTVIWEHNDLIDRVYYFDKLNEVPEPGRAFLLTYGWREGKYFIVPGDNGRFVNHSFTPNCIKNGNVYVAARDIQIGEEIVEDYSSYDDDFALYAQNLAHSSSG